MILTDVAYVIEAHFTMTDRAGPEDSPAKHAAMVERRATQGQCFHRPCLGTREFPAEFEWIAKDTPLPASELSDSQRNRDLGWMLHDIDFANGNASHFFCARIDGDGIVHVPAHDSPELMR